MVLVLLSSDSISGSEISLKENVQLQNDLEENSFNLFCAN